MIRVSVLKAPTIGEGEAQAMDALSFVPNTEVQDQAVEQGMQGTVMEGMVQGVSAIFKLLPLVDNVPEEIPCDDVVDLGPLGNPVVAEASHCVDAVSMGVLEAASTHAVHRVLKNGAEGVAPEVYGIVVIKVDLGGNMFQYRVCYAMNKFVGMEEMAVYVKSIVSDASRLMIDKAPKLLPWMKARACLASRLHVLGLHHNDLQPRNIMVKEIGSNNYALYLIDFGAVTGGPLPHKTVPLARQAVLWKGLQDKDRTLEAWRDLSFLHGSVQQDAAVLESLYRKVDPDVEGDAYVFSMSASVEAASGTAFPLPDGVVDMPYPSDPVQVADLPSAPSMAQLEGMVATVLGMKGPQGVSTTECEMSMAVEPLRRSVTNALVGPRKGKRPGPRWDTEEGSENESPFPQLPRFDDDDDDGGVGKGRGKGLFD